MVRVMREAISRQGAPADLFQCIEQPSVALTQYLMASCDLTLADLAASPWFELPTARADPRMAWAPAIRPW
jgi:hypothetical protein